MPSYLANWSTMLPGSTRPGVGTLNDAGPGGIMSPEMRARAMAYFAQQALGGSTQAPGPTPGGYNTAPTASPTTYAPPTGQYIPPGGGSPFPFNFPQAATPPVPGGYWRPEEFSRPATPYPTSPLAPATPAAGGALSHRASSVVPAPNIPAFTYVPPAHGLGGGYFPGHGARDQQNAQTAARAWANKHMTPQDRRNARRVASGAASYGNPGSSSSGEASGTGSYQDAYNEARAENEARYRDILTGMQDRYERNMNDLQGSGAMERQDINELYDAQAASMRQSLVGRGLGNSTVVDTMMMGNNEQRANSQGRLEERLRQQRIGLDADLSGDVLSFMERRTDSYTPASEMIALAEALGRAGYNQPGGVSDSGTSAASYAPVITGVDYVSPAQMGFNIPAAAWGPTMGVPMGYGGGGSGGGGGYDYEAAKRTQAARRQEEERRRAEYREFLRKSTPRSVTPAKFLSVGL